MAKSRKLPPIVLIFGEEEQRKSDALRAAVDELLSPEVDRCLALTELDGSRGDEPGGLSPAAVFDDLATLPFLSDRRVVVIREADKFISAHRERLENYAQSPSKTGHLILCCRSVPKNTRLYKAAIAAGGRAVECKKLSGRALLDAAIDAARARGKRIAPPVAQRLVGLVGEELGAILGEIEKLCLFAGDRAEIREQDVVELVGLSREEKIFACMDAAGAGDVRTALAAWHDVLATDRSAAFRAVGGVAFSFRKWLTAQRLASEGLSPKAIAPKAMMWGREALLGQILRRQPAAKIKRLLSRVADLDSQAKSGARSIETGIEALLLETAAPN